MNDRTIRQIIEGQVLVTATATLQDGKKLTATNVLTRVDADTFTMQFRDRTVDGQSIPDVPPTTMKRQNGNGTTPTAK